MQLSANCRSKELKITVSQIFERRIIASLGSCATRIVNPSIKNEEHVNFPFELLPMQQLFFEYRTSGYNHFVQEFLLRITRPVKPIDVIFAMKSIVARHSMLRARFTQGTDGSGAN